MKRELVRVDLTQVSVRRCVRDVFCLSCVNVREGGFLSTPMIAS